MLGAHVVVVEASSRLLGTVECFAGAHGEPLEAHEIPDRVDKALLGGLAGDAEVLADLGPGAPRSTAPVDEVGEEGVAQLLEPARRAGGGLQLDEHVIRLDAHLPDKPVQGGRHTVNSRLRGRRMSTHC